MYNILELLERSADKYPEKTAFSDPTDSITFKDLKSLARQTATLFLGGSLGVYVKAEEAVAFYMEKSTEAVAAMFGAVYAGAFYSFIDVRQPEERAYRVLSILEPKIIITDKENEEALRRLCEAHPMLNTVYVSVEELLKRARQSDISEKLLSAARAGFYDQMPLYVNFTSGSTGSPKGVAVSHRSVVDFISVFTETFSLSGQDIFANQAPFDFDVSVKDIYSGLHTGATVVLIPRDYFSKPQILMDYLSDNQVTVLVWAVSAMCFVSIMNGLEYRTPKTIRMVMFSGELMPVKQLRKWRKSLPDIRYINLYGPTEITCNCTWYELDREFEDDELIPVGKPFANEKVFLLDEEDALIEETSPGMEGEICVSGTCLALGYYRDPEKTSEVFVQNPLNSRFYERIYRTGDIGKYDALGNLIYTSRKDFQIKHLGQRIELSEIDVAAMSLEGVSRACTLYDMKKKKIVLFYTGDKERGEVSEGLRAKLPPYMLPAKTVPLNEMPLNKNGKIDRTVLSARI